MLKLFSKEKPSKTAFRAAWMRAWAYNDFQNQIWRPDFLAECFLPFPIRFLVQSERYREKGKANANAMSPGIYELAFGLKTTKEDKELK